MHLASAEERFNAGSTEFLRGFRPCQWLIGYPRCNKDEPVWLPGAVCYDATDIRLAADLKGKSDILAIPALNESINTFDQMALALHYHMYQLVIVANNGKYGGSSAYWPKRGHAKQVFHTYGQAQASVSFFEIDDIGAFLARHDGPDANATDWKHLPAGGPKSTRGST